MPLTLNNALQQPGTPARENLYAILPLPAHLLPQAGQCLLSADYKIVCQGKTPGWASLGELLASMLRPATGFEWPIAQGSPAPNTIALMEDPAIGHPEGYHLSIMVDGILIRAAKPAGAFYGIQSLRQLLPPEMESRSPLPGTQWAAPCAVIADEPRYVYRGLHLDVSRHIFPPEPLAIGGLLPLKKVYHYEPTPEELTAEEARYILGAQGNVWTEYMPDAQKVEYMTYPRAIALAEATWSPKDKRNYEDFINRLTRHARRMDALSLNYAQHPWQ